MESPSNYAIFIMVCISCGLLPVSAISSAQVGAQHLMDPIFAPTPAQSKISSNWLAYILHRSALRVPPCRTPCSFMYLDDR
jgi:hypothetical protein